MNIVMVSPYPRGDAVNGGIEAACYYLSNYLLSLGHSVEVVAPHLDAATKITVEDAGPIRITRVGRYPGIPNKMHILTFQIVAIRRVLSTLRRDVVHFHNNAYWHHSEKSDKKVVSLYGVNELDTSYRTDFFPRGLRAWAVRNTEGAARKSAPNVISTSPYLRGFLDESAKQRCWEIGNPIDERFFECAISDAEPGRLFSAGTICARKNVLGLIRSFFLLLQSNPCVNLRIAGAGLDSPYGRECQRLVQELRLENKVVFLGPLSVSRVREELQRAWCFVLVSFQETAPLAISEALAVGVPVVASRICGIPHMLQEGCTGWMVDPHNIQEIAQSLRRVIALGNRAEIGVNARRSAEEKYRVSSVAKKTVEIYKKICARNFS